MDACKICGCEIECNHWKLCRNHLEETDTYKIDAKEDIINKPNHYHDGVQPIEVIETNFEELETRGFLKGNVIKYVCRSNKNGKELEDLKKAQWNLNKLIERLEKNK
jgi:uncharacterized protein (UPF0179 family)